MIADLGLGSNLGDRLAYLRQAVAGLAADPATEVVDVSAVYRCQPVGGPPQGPYLNAVVRVRTQRSPHLLLALCQRLEEAAGRIRQERWAARTLDIDILRCEDLRLDGPDLVLPHPRLKQRAFVLIPLKDVDPTIDLAGVNGRGVDRTELRIAGAP